MNAFSLATLTLLAASSSISSTSAHADSPCGMRVIQSETHFPMRSQMRGHQGTVYINVTLDAAGHPTHAEVDRSSGHLLLDLAATRSVLKKWQFDVSNCNHSWPAMHQVAVEYRNEEYQ
jgi:protein TonB